MEEEINDTDPILNKLNGQQKTDVVQQVDTDPEDPILKKLNSKLKKKDVTESGSPSGPVSQGPVTPSKPSFKKSTRTNLTPDEEKTFQAWRLSLPKNLQEDTDLYDLRGAWKAGLQPEDGHLPSRDPKTGLILKSKNHPTFKKTIEGEEGAGYEIYEKNGRFYSKEKEGNFFERQFKLFSDEFTKMRKEASTPINEKDKVPSPFLNAIDRGVNLAKQASLIGPFEGEPDAKKLEEVAKLTKETQELPSSEAYKKFTQAESFDGAIKEFVKDPLKILAELTGESISAMTVYGAPRIAAGAGTGAIAGTVIPGIGTVSGAGGGAIVGMADTSFGLEFTGALLESLQQAGVDTTNPEQLKKAFESEEIISAARSHALKKGIPIALFDLVSGGLAGKIVSKPATSLLGKVSQAGVELAVQSVMGAAGETAGQVVSGEKIQPGAILSEAFGEVATTPVEVGVGAATFNKNNVQQEIDKQDGTDTNKSGDDVHPVQENNKGDEQSETKSGESSQGEGVLPATDEQSSDAKSTEGYVGLAAAKQKANEEINALVDSGDVTRVGNKVTIVTEKGGTEIKRIYEELEKAKQSGRSGEIDSTSDQGSERTVEQNDQGEKTSDQSANTEESTEQQRSGPENTTVDDTATTTEQPSQQPPAPDESVIPPPEPTKPSNEEGGDKRGRTYAIAERIFASDANETIKRGVKEKGSEYVPKGINITDKEATDLIELYGDDKAESLVRDTKNDLTGDTRTALAARLYEKYKRQADESSDPLVKSQNYDKAVDIALTSAEQLKEAGRQTNAAKIWKAITANEDMTVLAMEKENQRQGRYFLQPIYDQVKRSRQQFDAELRKAITEGVEANLKRAKLITEDQRKQIASKFDALKIKDVKGAANDVTRVLGAAVWNGSVEAVKRAVLAGADIANAVQAGVDYVKQNFKGNWDENEFRSIVTPAVEQMVPKEKVEVNKIDEKAITTPKLSGRKKKHFIEEVVNAHNEGKLTEEKFDQLYAKQLGAREFTSEDRQKIRELAKTISEVEQFEEKVKNDFTRENISKYKSLLDKAQRANTELQQFAQKPSNVWDTLISIMQGNLLTPISLVVNTYSNTALQPLRFASTGIGSIVDYSVSQLAKTGLLNESYKDTTIDLAELQKGYFQGGWNGLIEGLKQLKHGPPNQNLRDLSNEFSPSRAVARWSDADRSTPQKINDAIEGTFGWPAEAFFRMLNLGDKPFRRAAELARAMELGKQKGLKGVELEKFLMFPDDASKELIQKAGDDATFQQDNPTSQFVQNMLGKLMTAIGNVPIIGGPLKLIAKSQIPYVKTPWNIMVETLQYAAFPVTGAVGIHQIAKGNKRTGSVLIGKAIVGAIIFAVAKELFTKGLLSWDEPYDKEAGKQRERRQIQYDNIPPNALNVSAIQRGLIGDGWDIKDDDTWIDYNKLGVVGLLFDNYSNNYFSNIREKGQMPEQSDFYVDMFTTAPRVLSQSLDQSFLKGTNTLLTALQDGGGYETEQWLINTSQAISAIAYPNTLSTISKASDKFSRDLRDDDFSERLKNTYKNKFFIGDELPAKVNLWGDKITGQPEGRNKFAYYLFDPTKFKNVDTDNFKYKLYESWKEDKFNDDWLPSIPKRDMTIRGVKIKLTPAQYEQLATSVGQERARLVSTYVNSSAFNAKNKEKVIERLKDLYEQGRERGKKRFLMNSGLNLKTTAQLSEIAKK